MTSAKKTATLGIGGHQALCRPLSDGELQLAAALEQVFASGRHELAAVVEALQRLQVPCPSGASAPWTVQMLEAELRRINESLDQAYAGRHLASADR